MSNIKLAGLVAAALTAAATAQTTSLYIPGLDPQPVTANILGTGADGQTTWLIQPAASADPEDIGLAGPATLIAGPSSAKVIYDLPGPVSAHGEEDCTIDGTIANCQAVIVQGSMTRTDTLQETVSPIAVQGGGPLSGSSVPAAATSAPPAGSSAPSGASNSGASGTSPSATAPPSATPTGNGAGKVSMGYASLAIAVGAGIVALF